MSDIAINYLVENFKNVVPNGALLPENRARARAALTSIFSVIEGGKNDAWAIAAEKIGSGYEAALEQLRPDLERPVARGPLDFCADNAGLTGDAAVDHFLQGSVGSISGQKPQTVYLTGELPVPGPANSL